MTDAEIYAALARNLEAVAEAAERQKAEGFARCCRDVARFAREQSERNSGPEATHALKGGDQPMSEPPILLEPIPHGDLQALQDLRSKTEFAYRGALRSEQHLFVDRLVQLNVAIAKELRHRPIRVEDRT